MTVSHQSPIFVVEPPSDVRGPITECLEHAGHDVVTIESAREVAAAATRNSPAAVVLCLRSADANRRTALDALATWNGGPLVAVPVLIVAHDLDDQTRLRCAIEGALDVLDWPFDVADLVETLDVAIGTDAAGIEARRRQRRTAGLESLARWERTGVPSPPDVAGTLTSGHVRITRLERPATPAFSRHVRTARARASRLTPKQRRLLQALASGKPVTHVAEELGMSRSNVYTSLRRIGRRLGVEGTSELLVLAREGAFGGP